MGGWLAGWLPGWVVGGIHTLPGFPMRVWGQRPSIGRASFVPEHGAQSADSRPNPRSGPTKFLTSASTCAAKPRPLKRKRTARCPLRTGPGARLMRPTADQARLLGPPCAGGSSPISAGGRSNALWPPSATEKATPPPWCLARPRVLTMCGSAAAGSTSAHHDQCSSKSVPGVPDSTRIGPSKRGLERTCRGGAGCRAPRPPRLPGGALALGRAKTSDGGLANSPMKLGGDTSYCCSLGGANNACVAAGRGTESTTPPSRGLARHSILSPNNRASSAIGSISVGPVCLQINALRAQFEANRVKKHRSHRHGVPARPRLWHSPTSSGGRCPPGFSLRRRRAQLGGNAPSVDFIWRVTLYCRCIQSKSWPPLRHRCFARFARRPRPSGYLGLPQPDECWSNFVLGGAKW